MPSLFAQQGSDSRTTNANVSRSATSEHTFTVTVRLQNLVADSIGVSFLDHTGFNVAYSGTQDIFDTHLVILLYLVQGRTVITPWIVMLTWTSSFQPSASVPTFGLRASHALGHTVSIHAPIVTHMPAGVVGVLHAIAILPFMWRPPFVGYPVPHEAVGTKTGDRVVLIPALEASSG
jgi:hypothetical protein